MRHDAFELTDTRRESRGPWHAASPHDRAEEAIAIAAALEKGPTLEGRMHARYAGILAGRRGARADDLPHRFTDDGVAALASAWDFGRKVAAHAATQRAHRTLDNAGRMARLAAGLRPRKDLDG